MPSLSTLPNARFQPLGMAGAKHEQRLFPVGCKPLFGQDFHLSIGCLVSQAPCSEE